MPKSSSHILGGVMCRQMVGIHRQGKDVCVTGLWLGWRSPRVSGDCPMLSPLVSTPDIFSCERHLAESFSLQVDFFN